jgi:hypothetical protein
MVGHGRNICLTGKNVRVLALGAVCALVSVANGTNRDKVFIQLKQLLELFL